MTQELLRFTMAVLLILAGGWILVLALWMGVKKGVRVLLARPKNSIWQQKAVVTLAVIQDAYIVMRVPFPGIDRFVLAGPSPTPALAVCLFLIGMTIMIATQVSMGKSWRIGVPKSEKGEAGNDDIEELSTSGFMKLSRNPIYLGIMVMIVAIALAAPGPLTIISIFLSFIWIECIIEEEEKYLTARFGEAYLAYCAKVRRWL